MAKLLLFVSLALVVSLSVSMTLTSGADNNQEDLEPVDSDEVLAKSDGLTLEQERAKQRALREEESPKLWEDSIDQNLIDRLSHKQELEQQQNQNEI